MNLYFLQHILEQLCLIKNEPVVNMKVTIMFTKSYIEGESSVKTPIFYSFLVFKIAQGIKIA